MEEVGRPVRGESRCRLRTGAVPVLSKAFCYELSERVYLHGDESFYSLEGGISYVVDWRDYFDADVFFSICAAAL